MIYFLNYFSVLSFLYKDINTIFSKIIETIEILIFFYYQLTLIKVKK